MRRRTRAIVAAVVLGAVALAAWAMAGRADGGETGELRPADAMALGDSARAPDSVRVRVEVLNATTVRGLARRATMHLRDRGYDVVATGNSSEKLDSTVVLVRAGDEAWARRVAMAMGGARVEARPDTSRYLDVTVLVGGSWRPPPGAFRP